MVYNFLKIVSLFIMIIGFIVIITDYRRDDIWKMKYGYHVSITGLGLFTICNGIYLASKALIILGLCIFILDIVCLVIIYKKHKKFLNKYRCKIHNDKLKKCHYTGICPYLEYVNCKEWFWRSLTSCYGDEIKDKFYFEKIESMHTVREWVDAWKNDCYSIRSSDDDLVSLIYIKDNHVITNEELFVGHFLDIPEIYWNCKVRGHCRWGEYRGRCGFGLYINLE